MIVYCLKFCIHTSSTIALFTNVCDFDFFVRKCKTHPGPVVHISGNPVDPNKV